MEVSTYFKEIPQTPELATATNSVARFVDSLGFRYYWATEGLTNSEFTFRPHPTSMDMASLLEHLYSMSKYLNRTFGVSVHNATSDTLEDFRYATLANYESLSKQFKDIKDSSLNDLNSLSDLKGKHPFWYYLNGPIADSLTHVGQVTSWRRIAGNPQPTGINAFFGTRSE